MRTNVHIMQNGTSEHLYHRYADALRLSAVRRLKTVRMAVLRIKDVKGMDYVTFTECLGTADKNAAKSLRSIDSECASCLYEAGKIAVEDILMTVIENELTDKERKALMLRWFENRKTSAISAELGIGGDSVRKLLKKAESKIYNSLKYVVLYNNIIGGKEELPKSFHFKIINCINGKELIS